MKMVPEQRKKLLKQFDDTTLRPAERTGKAGTAKNGGQPSTPCSSSKHISISFDECGIDLLPLSVIQAIWAKAEKYLQSKSDIVPSPGNDSRSMMVVSQSSPTPHCVCGLPTGQFLCDSNCLQWKSSQICSHVVAVSDKLGELSSFLKWFINTKQQPNVTSLAMHGLPAGRGRKGGVPKRKRRSASDVHVPRPVLTSRSTTDPLNQGRVRGSNGAHSPSDSSVTGGILSSQESMHRGCRNVSDDGDFPLPRERPVWEISDGTFPSATISGSSAQMHTAHSLCIPSQLQVYRKLRQL